MSDKILVTYATRYGSTQEVAEAIARQLRDAGRQVDLQPLKSVKDPAAYQAIVLGAPLYIGKWHKDALTFLEAHQASLTQRPVAVFALGPLSTNPNEMAGARAALDEALASYPWLQPVATEMFIGKYDPARLSLPHKLIAILPASPLHGLPASDNRNWDAITAWTTDLAGKLA